MFILYKLTQFIIRLSIDAFEHVHVYYLKYMYLLLAVARLLSCRLKKKTEELKQNTVHSTRLKVCHLLLARS